MSAPEYAKVLKDLDAVDRDAKAIMVQRGMPPEELVILGGHFLRITTDNALHEAYGEWSNAEKERERDYAKVRRALAATGIPWQRLNACAMALTLGCIREAEFLARPIGGPPA